MATERRKYPPVDKDFAASVGIDEVEYLRIVDRLGRPPNEFECNIFSALWSEEYSNKSSSSLLDTIIREIDNHKIAGSRVGTVPIGDGELAVIRVCHNNQLSNVEPQSGAQTAVASAVESLTSAGAEPLAVMNLMRFGAPESVFTQKIFREAVEGLSSFSNSFGTPMLGGELYFHPRYDNSILVNCFSIGFTREEFSTLKQRAGIGSALIYAGAPTGRDGLMNEEKKDKKEVEEEDKDNPENIIKKNLPRLKITDPFLSQRILYACAEAAQKKIVTDIVSLGAGGLSTGLFDISSKVNCPVKVILDRIPTTTEGFKVKETLLSESCDRILIAVPKNSHRAMTDILYKWNIKNVTIGDFIDSDALEIIWKHHLIANIPFKFAVKGAIKKEFEVVKFPPMLKRIDANAPVELKSKQLKKKIKDDWEIVRDVQAEKARAKMDEVYLLASLEDTWLDLMANPNLCSRKLLIRQFDQKINGNTVLEAGGDSGLIRLRKLKGYSPDEPQKGLAFTLDSNSLYAAVDPYLGTVQTVAEGMRNLAAVGAQPIAIANCLNFGDPARYREICDLAEAVRALGDCSHEWGIPIISDTVNLYNGSEANPIMPTPAIAMLGIVDDVRKSRGINFKNPGDKIFLLGETKAEVTCSEYAFYVHHKEDGLVPEINFAFEKKICEFIRLLTNQNLLASAHDISAGGIALAFAECCMSRTPPIGATLELQNTLGEVQFRPEYLVFSETAGRFIISFDKKLEDEIRSLCKENGIPITGEGEVGAKTIGFKGAVNCEIPLASAFRIWSPGLRHMLGLNPESVLLYDLA